jgi:[calcium/calmodulin-dependent protein kinase] kinase
MSQEIHQVKETATVVKDHDDEGNKVVNQYTFEKLLGQGTYGKVKLVHKNEPENKFAAKIIKKDVLKKRREMIRDERGRVKYKDAFENVLMEIAIMKKLNHPNIVKLYEVIDNPESNKLYIVMDFVEKGQIIEWDEESSTFYNLSQKEYLDETELRKIFAQIIQGLFYLHQNGIVHRDIKPQNILQSGNGTIKIADFGVSAIVGEQDVMKKAEGTYHFMPPECVSTEPNPDGFSGRAADIWAMGISFFAFAFYKVPFLGETPLELFENIEKQELEFPEDRPVSNELKDLLRKVLEKDVKQRPSLEYAFFFIIRI